MRRRPDLHGEGEEEGGGGEEGVVVWEGASRWRRGATVRVSKPRKRKESAAFCTCSIRRGGW